MGGGNFSLEKLDKKLFQDLCELSERIEKEKRWPLKDFVAIWEFKNKIPTYKMAKFLKHNKDIVKSVLKEMEKFFKDKEFNEHNLNIFIDNFYQKKEVI